MSPAGTSVSCADIFAELCHKALAECHNLAVRFSLGIEIGAALAATDRQACQGVFEYLLKAQEFDDTKVYGRMESQASLVRSDGAVELYTVSGIHLYLSLVIYPRNTEFQLSLRINDSLQQSFSAEFLLICINSPDLKGLQNLFHCLMELRLCGILFDYLLILPHQRMTFLSPP